MDWINLADVSTLTSDGAFQKRPLNCVSQNSWGKVLTKTRAASVGRSFSTAFPSLLSWNQLRIFLPYKLCMCVCSVLYLSKIWVHLWNVSTLYNEQSVWVAAGNE